jgi:nicotinate-nucleotide adenylyltransferase
MPVSEFEILQKYKQIGIYGGSFDPIHRGHMSIAGAILPQFLLDAVVFIPAFHAPHKKRSAPTPALDRFTMVNLATNDDARMLVSKMEIELPERPYSVQTLARLKSELPDTKIFFVIGADSWADITTWRRWEEVLSMTNHIVITRPGYPITFDNVTPEIRSRIVDMRGIPGTPINVSGGAKIYVTDAVNVDVSATAIRQKVREGDSSWKDDVPSEVAKYIEKYQIYN